MGEGKLPRSGFVHLLSIIRVGVVINYKIYETYIHVGRIFQLAKQEFDFCPTNDFMKLYSTNMWDQVKN